MNAGAKTLGQQDESASGGQACVQEQFLNILAKSIMASGGIRSRFWIDMALECIRRDHTALSAGVGPSRDQGGPFLSARAMGLALTAMHDIKAFAAGQNSIVTLGKPADIGNLKTADAIDVAAAAACLSVLLKRYPSQAVLLTQAWTNWIEFFRFSSSLNAGDLASSEKIGRDYGTTVEQLGSSDTAIANKNTYVPTLNPYTHQASPVPRKAPNGTPIPEGFAGSAWGEAKHLVLSKHLSFAPPPGRKSATTVNSTVHYQKDFDQVAAKGEFSNPPASPNPRTLEEEFTGIYWGYDGSEEIGTPPRLYMQVVLSVLDAIQDRVPGRLSDQEELLIIAAVAVAMADAGIEAWHFKYSPEHMMWRPIVGIRNAQPGNGSPDPSWLPLGLPATNTRALTLTPDFPAYPSGHATFGAAAFQLLRLFLAEKAANRFQSNGIDDVNFSFVSDEFDGRNREPRRGTPRDRVSASYDSLWDAIIANSLSRVYLGVHWQFDGVTKRNPLNTDDEFGVPNAPNELGKTGGVWLGCMIANEIGAKLGISPKTIGDSGIS